jgi:hypothetical protein
MMCDLEIPINTCGQIIVGLKNYSRCRWVRYGGWNGYQNTFLLLWVEIIL